MDIVFCGVPRIQYIYHTGLYRHIEVAVTDIGRAPQVEPATGDERLEPEPMPPGKPATTQPKRQNPAHLTMREIIANCLSNEPDGLSYHEVARRTGLTYMQVTNCVHNNLLVFRPGKRRAEGVRGRPKKIMWMTLREDRHD